MTYSIAELNQMSQAEFVTAVGAAFEDTPEVAAAVWGQRPFSDARQLHRAMMRIVERFDAEAQLRLICAHPDLGSRLQMAAASVQEQSGAGLDRLSAAEYEQFYQLNQAYRQKFGFPFIIAVRHHTKDSILAAFEQRLQHDKPTEMQQALTEIGEIAKLRLLDWVG